MGDAVTGATSPPGVTACEKTRDACRSAKQPTKSYRPTSDGGGGFGDGTGGAGGRRGGGGGGRGGFGGLSDSTMLTKAISLPHVDPQSGGSGAGHADSPYCAKLHPVHM